MFFKYILKCKNIRPLALIKFRTLIFKLAIYIGLFPNVRCNGDVRVVQSLNIQGRGEIALGHSCSLGFYPSPNMYHGECYLEARYPDSKLIIGDRVFINNNAVVIADKSIIVIGDDTLIGPNFFCIGSNFHPLNPTKRLTSEYQSKPIYIGRNVFIGANVTILQGVTIGDNSVIAAGTTIYNDVPANTIVKIDTTQIQFFDLRCD
ncbi:transferase [Aeromonas salmonicida]|nr:transferase [Aeromonas salmonicida]